MSKILMGDFKTILTVQPQFFKAYYLPMYFHILIPANKKRKKTAEVGSRESLMCQ